MNRQGVVVIAEAGVNHDGSLDRAKQLVDAASGAKADYVKFQTFKAQNLVTESAPKAAYQVRATGGTESQHEMLKRLELSVDDHKKLVEHCQTRKIQFLSSPFDEEGLAFLAHDLRLEQIKIGSGELTNAPLLLAAARTNKRLILSTGMSSLGEVEEALGVVAFGYGCNPHAAPCRASFAETLQNAESWECLRRNVTLLHCTTEYPAPIEETNLRAMQTMQGAFGLPVGYSDHTLGIAVSVAAVALGATLIEKHLTLDTSLSGPDHAASATPEEFASMVSAIRSVEQALGTGIKQPGKAELPNRAIARRSIVAARSISRGAVIEADDLAIRRPGTGRSPMDYWAVVGSLAQRDYQPGDILE